MDELSSDVTDRAREHLLRAQEKAKALKRQLEESERIIRVWDDLLRFASREWSMHLLDLLEKQADTFRKLGESDSQVPYIVDRVSIASKAGADEVIRRYPAHLEESFRRFGLSLDPESRHPRYSLDNRFFQLEIDERKRTARLSDNEGRLTELPADIGAIVESIQRERKRIFGRRFEPIEFLKKLRMNYLAVAGRDNLRDGSSVPIRRITSRMGKNIKGFRTDEFIADLSRLVETGPLQIDGRQLDLQQTKDTNQGMLLHNVAARGYVGFIVFREA